MSTEITATGDNALAAILSDPARLKEIPVDTVERLFAIDREIRADAARREFSAAFNQLQGALAPVRKKASNPQTRSLYAKLEDIERMLMPLVEQHGFSVSQSTADPVVPDTMRIVLTVRHVGGHEERHYLDAPPDFLGPKGQPVKTRLHGMGSTLTYAKRRLLCDVFGVTLTDHDDDGNGGGIGPGAEPISESQAADLTALLTEVGADQAKFLAYFKIDALADLPAARRIEAVRMLEAKRAKS